MLNYINGIHKSFSISVTVISFTTAFIISFFGYANQAKQIYDYKQRGFIPLVDLLFLLYIVSFLFGISLLSFSPPLLRSWCVFFSWRSQSCSFYIVLRVFFLHHLISVRYFRKLLPLLVQFTFKLTNQSFLNVNRFQQLKYNLPTSVIYLSNI